MLLPKYLVILALLFLAILITVVLGKILPDEKKGFGILGGVLLMFVMPIVGPYFFTKVYVVDEPDDADQYLLMGSTEYTFQTGDKIILGTPRGSSWIVNGCNINVTKIQ